MTVEAAMDSSRSPRWCEPHGHVDGLGALLPEWTGDCVAMRDPSKTGKSRLLRSNAVIAGKVGPLHRA
jgi:hypothetical protein